MNEDAVGEHQAMVAPPAALMQRSLVVSSKDAPLSSPVSFSGGEEFLKYQADIGERGPKQPRRADYIEGLVAAASASDTAQPDIIMQNTACCMIYSEHTRRQLADDVWCDAFAIAAASVKSLAQCAAARPHVLVCGLGSGIPALAAGRAGCDVIWAVRVVRFAELAQKLVARNGLTGRVRVVRVNQWSSLGQLAQERQIPRPFEAVITEDVGDDPIADGLLILARMLHKSWLLPLKAARQGLGFVPRKLRLYAVLLSVRTQDVAGFDLRGFNAFRNNSATWYDYEHVVLMEKPHYAQCLSRPQLLLEIDLNAATSRATSAAGLRAAVAVGMDSAVGTHAAQLVCSTGGVLNAVQYWAELEMPGQQAPINLGPPGLVAGDAGEAPPPRPPRPQTSRARRQQLHFLPYDRRVASGEPVRVALSVEWQSISLEVRSDAAADAAAEAAGQLIRWPRLNLLAYHFPMIADESRNGAFDRALRAAIAAHTERHGGVPPRVLDIGSGSGLLAMMAARAGATEVHSLEVCAEVVDGAVCVCVCVRACVPMAATASLQMHALLPSTHRAAARASGRSLRAAVPRALTYVIPLSRTYSRRWYPPSPPPRSTSSVRTGCRSE